jgi:hypothetical protein
MSARCLAHEASEEKEAVFMLPTPGELSLAPGHNFGRKSKRKIVTNPVCKSFEREVQEGGSPSYWVRGKQAWGITFPHNLLSWEAAAGGVRTTCT